MKLNKFLVLFFVFSIIFALAACSQKRSSDSSNRVIREVVDMAGRTIVIPEKINKVFVDWGQGKVQLMAINALDKAVAVDPGINAENFNWARTFIVGMQNVNVDQDPYTNMEKLLSYEPDVVFTIEHARKANEYEIVGIPVVVLRFDDFDSYLQALEVMGYVLGDKYEENVKALKKFFDDKIGMVEERIATIDDSTKKTIYYVAGSTDGSNPLDTMTSIFETSFIERVGGKLVTKELETPSGYITLSKEKLLELDPEIILNGAQYRHLAEQKINDDIVLKELKAIRANKFYRVPQGIFGWSKMGPEYGLNIIWAAKLFYPNLFEDVDMAKLTQDFYRDFYGVDVSTDYILMILAGKIPPDGK
jgi:iron complex transport system substrate-binding protein